MALIKFVSPSGWDFDRPVAVPIKYSSRGLIGNDRADFIKTASHELASWLDNVKIASDETPIHLIALGAGEAYGANRNGDYFGENTCRKNHNTFVKFARCFRNHKNKPDKGHPHFGIVKASAYNEPMRRVELLTVLNNEKSAADRNGGFVADRELEKIASGRDLAVSMAGRVPYDVCSWCNNQAKTRDDYCTKTACDAGGCRENITRVVKLAGDLHHLHVKNPYVTWFDISDVFRPADRIAWGAKADYMTKAAADGGLFELADMIKMAEDAEAPLEVILYQDGVPGEWSVKMAAQTKLAYGLAVVDRQELSSDNEVCRAFTDQPAFPVERLGTPGTTKCAENLGALADKKIILHIRDFARLDGNESLTKEALDRLPGVYQRMMDDETLERRVSTNPYQYSEKLASADVRTLANQSVSEFSLDREHVAQRSMLSSIRGHAAPNPKTSFEKCASDNAEAEELARRYAMYKLAALEKIAASDTDFPLTARITMRQNHIS